MAAVVDGNVPQKVHTTNESTDARAEPFFEFAECHPPQYEDMMQKRGDHRIVIGFKGKHRLEHLQDMGKKRHTRPVRFIVVDAFRDRVRLLHALALELSAGSQDPFEEHLGIVYARFHGGSF